MADAPVKAAAPPKEKVAKKAKGGVDLKSLAPAPFVADRLALFDRLYAAQQEAFAAKAQPIEIKMADGTIKPAQSFVTTPFMIANAISPRLAEASIIARITTPDGQEHLWDMGRPFEFSGQIEFLDWEYAEAKKVFWHSSAHVLGRAMERALGCKLISGPPLKEGGFFYEADTDGRALTDDDYTVLEAAAKELILQKAPFQRLEVNRSELLQLISYNDLKSELLGSKVPEDGVATVYRCGDLIDPCRGPHIIHTGAVKAFKVTKHGASFFLGQEGNPTLQRVYAMTFPNQKLLDAWVEAENAAKERHHKKVATQQELFMIGHEAAPGAGFWFPHGARIYNTLANWMRREQRLRGFDEVITPNMFSCNLWKQSGHWQKYKDDMFTLTVEGEQHGLKPMNCPSHALMFAARMRSVKELPIRYSDYGVLHRNERSGALSGMTRVRRFCQDDAHIFCTEEQVTKEVRDALQFIEDTYRPIGFTTSYKLSTRPAPEKRFGSEALWDRAEGYLAIALNEFCGTHGPEGAELPDPFVAGKTFVYDGTEKAYHNTRKLIAQKKWPAGHPEPTRLWELEPGDGAFYGPKVDIQVMDAMGRGHQCATLQLDFNLPVRFNLKYMGATEKADAVEEKPEGAEVDRTSAARAGASAEEDPYANPEKLPAGWHRPVMIHRAIFGSLERFIAIAAEHFEGGKWPFWLSPRQAMVVPVASAYDEYAQKVQRELFVEDYHVDVDLSTNTLNKKVRAAQLARYNFVLVVGEAEQKNGSVNVRSRDGKVMGEKTIEELLAWWKTLVKTQDREL